jgi:septal ring factor EnvC (AmiA/AmiB activator)
MIVTLFVIINEKSVVTTKMYRKEGEGDDSLLETIELTTKLERSLRKLMTNRKSHLEKTITEESREEQNTGSTLASLEREVRRLREENKELHSDNEQICRDLLRLRGDNRDLKKENAEQKKYITHLQSYNEDLKKELLFWMRKPTKPHPSDEQED